MVTYVQGRHTLNLTPFRAAYNQVNTVHTLASESSNTWLFVS